MPRGWLCYSLSAGHVFCLHAKYLARTRKSQQFVSGDYFDWKHANDCIAEHESCDIHRKAMIAYISQAADSGTVDSEVKNSSVRSVNTGRIGSQGLLRPENAIFSYYQCLCRQVIGW